MMWFFAVAAAGAAMAAILTGVRVSATVRGSARVILLKRSGMDRDVVALAGFIPVFVLILLREPIGIEMRMVAVIGSGVLTRICPAWNLLALNLLANVPFTVLTDDAIAVIPLFILMGAFVSHSDMSPELCTAVSGIIDFVGSHFSINVALRASRKGGKVVIVGLFGVGMTLSTALLSMRDISLIGSYVGTLAEMKELLELVKRDKIFSVPLKQRSMDEISDILTDLRLGRVQERVLW